MGVVNVTPDSFSDGGQWLDTSKAISHARQLIADGATVIDIGGESTFPGTLPVSPEEEIARVVPVVQALASEIKVSIDTKKADVAAAAIAAGATLLNDVSASLWQVAADLGVGWVAMHMQGDPLTMQKNPTDADVVAEVAEYLSKRAEQAQAAGVKEIWIDPGLGFGKTLEHNVQLMRHLDTFAALPYPLLVGASRKTFLGKLTIEDNEVPRPDDRHDASIAAAVWAMTKGAAMIRVHDVKATVRAARVISAFQQPTDLEGQAA